MMPAAAEMPRETKTMTSRIVKTTPNAIKSKLERAKLRRLGLTLEEQAQTMAKIRPTSGTANKSCTPKNPQVENGAEISSDLAAF